VRTHIACEHPFLSELLPRSIGDVRAEINDGTISLDRERLAFGSPDSQLEALAENISASEMDCPRVRDRFHRVLERLKRGRLVGAGIPIVTSFGINVNFRQFGSRVGKVCEKE
jgi:hypothetical protein